MQVLQAMLVALAAYGGGVESERPQPYLRWELRSEPAIAPNRGERAWYQDTVVFHDADGRELWRRELPQRMRANPTRIGNAEAEGHARFPRTTHNLYFLVGLLYRKDELVIADASGVLVLSRRDGKPLLDLPVAQREESHERFSVDRGEATVRGEAPCVADWHHDGFLGDGGSRLFFFNGSTLAVIETRGWNLLEKVTYERTKHEREALRATRRATIPFTGGEVALEGAIYMR